MTTFDLNTEMIRLNLNDKRLNERCLQILKSFEKCPEDSIPSACKTHREIKAAYRFFKNPKATSEKILAPHIESTILRCRNQPVVLFIEDTTEEDFTDNSKLQGKNLGRLDHFDRQGFYSHTAIAVTPEGTPLGILSNRFFSRVSESISNTRDYRKTPLNKKESFRWVEGIRSASALAKELSHAQVIYVADRESDTFHCLFEATKEETSCDIVIRACKDRNTTSKIKGTKKSYKRMFKALAELPIQGEVTFKTQSGHGKKSREITQTIRFENLEVKPFRSQATEYHNVQINAIMLCEEKPSEGTKAVNWVLLTTLPINSIEEVLRVIRIYCMRWKIEVFFKILKNCKIEDLKLVDASRLKTCIALYMIVSWRLLLIQHIGKVYPDKPCTIVFTELEWKVVCLSILKMKKESFDKLPKEAPPLKEFIRSIGILGGFLGRVGDGDPGPKAICQGYVKMHALVEGWELCQKFQVICG